MCMIDGAEPYYPYTTKQSIARKEHVCDECGRAIAPGERYERMTGMLERQWDTAKTCSHCIWARDWLTGECGGYCHYGVLEDLEEHWTSELIRDLDLGRRIVGMRRKWQHRDGSLMELAA